MLRNRQGNEVINYEKITTDISNLKSNMIVEQGSNSDGNYIKYADGTLICYNTVSKIISINNPYWNIGYRSDYGVSINNYPVPFLNIPTASLTVSGFEGWTMVTSNSTTTVPPKFMLLTANFTTPLTSQNVKISYIAIGKWK